MKNQNIQETAKIDLYKIFLELSNKINEEEETNISDTEIAQNIEKVNISRILRNIKEMAKNLRSKNIRKEMDEEPPQISAVENQLREYEKQKRNDIKKYFFLKYQKESLEYRMEEYFEIEEEFKEMKSKYKTVEKSFKEEEEKENKIVKIRNENTNLKKLLDKKSIVEKELKDNLLTQQKSIDELTSKIKKLETSKSQYNFYPRQFNLSPSQNKENFKFAESSSNTIDQSNYLSHKNESKIGFNYINIYPKKCNKIEPNQSINIKNKKVLHKNISSAELKSSAKVKKQKQGNKKSHQRNNSMNVVLDKKKIDLFSKYFCKQMHNQKSTKKKNNDYGLSISQSSIPKKYSNKFNFNKSSGSNQIESKGGLNSVSCHNKLSNGNIRKNSIKKENKKIK